MTESPPRVARVLGGGIAAMDSMPDGYVSYASTSPVLSETELATAMAESALAAAMANTSPVLSESMPPVPPIQKIATDSVAAPVASDGYPSEVNIIEEALREARTKLSSSDSAAKEVIEATLREARGESPVSARGFAPSISSLGLPLPLSSTMDYTQADAANVSAYGAKLKGWIDMHVDMRLDMVLPPREQETIKLRAEVEAIKDVQTRLLDAVEGVCQELGKLKGASRQQDKIHREILSQDAGEIKQAVENLSSDILIIQREMTTEIERIKVSIADCERLAAESAKVAKEEIAFDRDIAQYMRDEADAVSRLDRRIALLDQRFDKRIVDLAAKCDEIAGSTAQSMPIYRSPEPFYSPSSELGRPYSVRTMSPRSPPRWNFVGPRLMSEQDPVLADEQVVRQDVLRISAR